MMFSQMPPTALHPRRVFRQAGAPPQHPPAEIPPVPGPDITPPPEAPDRPDLPEYVPPGPDELPEQEPDIPPELPPDRLPFSSRRFSPGGGKTHARG